MKTPANENDIDTIVDEIVADEKKAKELKKALHDKMDRGAFVKPVEADEDLFDNMPV